MSVDLESQQEERLLGHSGTKFIYEAEASVRSGFIRKVYGILGIQLILTTVIATVLALKPLSWIRSNQWLMTIGFVGSLCTIFPLICVPGLGRKSPWNLIFLAIFTASEGILLGFVSAQYALESVLIATALTAALFVTLSILALTTTIDFTKLYPYLIAFTFALIVLGIVSFFLPHIQSLRTAYGAIAALLFSAYIVADTQMISSRDSERRLLVDDYVFAAIAIYLDIINLFLAILQLLGRRRQE